MKRSPNRWKGFILGALGGVAGLMAMQSYWKSVTALAGTDPRVETVPGTHALDDIAVAGQHHLDSESSTAAMGRIGYRTVTGEQPRSDQLQNMLSYAVHWEYGMLQSGLYGALRGRSMLPDVPGALAFGTALWLFGDELAVPLLGLAQGPTAFPLNQHIHRFGAHLAFGLASTSTTQLLYRLL